MEHDSVTPTWVHASAVVIGEAGLLIRGSAGAGKTSLALALVEEARRSGRFSRLVADDTVGLQVLGGRLVARPHPRTAGLVERRGVGIIPVDHEPASVLRLVADFLAKESGTGAYPRLPDAGDLRVVLMGVALPRLPLLSEGASRDNAQRVLEHCGLFRPSS